MAHYNLGWPVPDTPLSIMESPFLFFFWLLPDLWLCLRMDKPFYTLRVSDSFSQQCFGFCSCTISLKLTATSIIDGQIRYLIHGWCRSRTKSLHRRRFIHKYIWRNPMDLVAYIVSRISSHKKKKNIHSSTLYKMGLRSWLVKGMSMVRHRGKLDHHSTLKNSAHYKIRQQRQRRRSGLLYKCPKWSSGQVRSHVIFPSLKNLKKLMPLHYPSKLHHQYIPRLGDNGMIEEFT